MAGNVFDLNDFFNRHNVGVPSSAFKGKQYVERVSQALATHLAQMFASNWSFKAKGKTTGADRKDTGLEDVFPLTTQKLLLMGYALYGNVGLQKSKGNRPLPVKIGTFNLDPFTAEVMDGLAFPLTLWLSKDGKTDLADVKGSLADTRNTAFLTSPLGFTSLTDKVKPWIEKYGTISGVQVANALTSQNKFALATDNEALAKILSSQLLAVGEPFFQSRNKDADLKNPQVAGRTNLSAVSKIEPVPTQPIASSEIINLLDHTKNDIFDMYGVRRNSNFKKERNITAEFDNQEITQTIAEEITLPWLEAFVVNFKKVFGVEIELVDELANMQAEQEGENQRLGQNGNGDKNETKN